MTKKRKKKKRKKERKEKNIQIIECGLFGELTFLWIILPYSTVTALLTHLQYFPSCHQFSS